MTWFPVLLALHISLALMLFLPSMLLPFTMRSRGRDGEPAELTQGSFIKALLWLQANGTVVIGAGVAITGVLLVLSLGSSVVSQPWFQVAILLYAANLVLALFVQRPNLRRLIGLRSDATAEEKARWRARARRQRYVSYLMALVIGVIGWLMATKP